jgi:hypothetical protein
MGLVAVPIAPGTLALRNAVAVPALLAVAIADAIALPRVTAAIAAGLLILDFIPTAAAPRTRLQIDAQAALALLRGTTIVVAFALLAEFRRDHAIAAHRNEYRLPFVGGDGNSARRPLVHRERRALATTANAARLAVSIALALLAVCDIPITTHAPAVGGAIGGRLACLTGAVATHRL